MSETVFDRICCLSSPHTSLLALNVATNIDLREKWIVQGMARLQFGKVSLLVLLEAVPSFPDAGKMKAILFI